MTLKDARLNTGLSQEDFASAIGVSISSVRNWEQYRKPMCSISASALLNIAYVCNFTDVKQLRDLIYENDGIYLKKSGL